MPVTLNTAFIGPAPSYVRFEKAAAIFAAGAIAVMFAGGATWVTLSVPLTAVLFGTVLLIVTVPEREAPVFAPTVNCTTKVADSTSTFSIENAPTLVIKGGSSKFALKKFAKTPGGLLLTTKLVPVMLNLAVIAAPPCTTFVNAVCVSVVGVIVITESGAASWLIAKEPETAVLPDRVFATAIV